MCADHTLCMVCMVCTHHPNYTLTVTTPCRWHVDRQRGRREGKKRERRGSLLLPSITHPAGTHHPSSPLLPSLPPSLSLSSTPTTHILTPSPPLIWLTITSTSLHLSLNPPLLSHTRPNPHPMHVPVQRKRSSSSSSSSPTTRVPHHHQQLKSSSTCMPHMHTQATSGTCVSK